MVNCREILENIQKFVQQRKIEIKSILYITVPAGLHSVLCAHLKEYDAIAQEIRNIASMRGWELAELEPVKCLVIKARYMAHIFSGVSNTQIIEKAVSDCKNASKRCLKCVNGYHRDDTISAISMRLLDCEQASIQRLKGFL